MIFHNMAVLTYFFGSRKCNLGEYNRHFEQLCIIQLYGNLNQPLFDFVVRRRSWRKTCTIWLQIWHLSTRDLLLRPFTTRYELCHDKVKAALKQGSTAKHVNRLS